MEIQQKPQKYLSKLQAREKIEHYCAYQERSQKEVRNKLYELGLKSSDVEEMISDLIQTNFINEERFALAYARGKFRMKQWGKIKIKQGLKIKGITDRLLKTALASIDDEQYIQTLLAVLQKKSVKISEKDSYKRRYKLSQYAMLRGFEPDIIAEVLTNSDLG
jgi:regulatory protein